MNVDENLTTTDLPANPQPVATHNYNFSEGELYGYLGAISDDDRKKGIAAPSVIRFRYTGFWDGAQHLEVVDDNGTTAELDECSVPCVAIKATSYNGAVRRIGYSTGSIVGAAFEDAMNGQLHRSPTPGTVKDGYRFRGGDPRLASNWQLIAKPPEPSSSEDVNDTTTDSNAGDSGGI
ncbi:MAG: hypothetical protein ABI454_03615 [Sphingomicrobium sp.]